MSRTWAIEPEMLSPVLWLGLMIRKAGTPSMMLPSGMKIEKWKPASRLAPLRHWIGRSTLQSICDQAQLIRLAFLRQRTAKIAVRAPQLIKLGPCGKEPPLLQLRSHSAARDARRQDATHAESKFETRPARTRHGDEQ